MSLGDLSFREKSAWISFLSILGVFTPFFWTSYQRLNGAVDGRTAVSTAFGLLVLFVVLEIVLHVALALWSPREARTPKDERERLIELRATFIAFHVLVVGALAGVATLHLTRSAWIIQQVVLLAIVVAELVKFGAEIVLFRRDA
ncbi:MAG: hypothetical protein R2708_01670 [Vicinamibacterales bacterium]